MSETDRAAIRDILGTQPDLGFKGFACEHGASARRDCRYPYCGKPREAQQDLADLRTDESIAMIEAAMSKLDMRRRTKTVDKRSPTSRRIQRYVQRRFELRADWEPVVRGYVSNGQVIAAALACHFPVRRQGDNSPDAWIGIYRADFV